MSGVQRSKLRSTNCGAAFLLAVACGLACPGGAVADAAGRTAGGNAAPEELVGKPSVEAESSLGAQGGTPPAAALPVSPDTLKSSDHDASQRLRFDIGDRVFFSAGSAKLGSRARLVLSRQAQWLKAWKASAVIAGHGDEGVNGEIDDRIGLERAEAVRERLVEEGVTPLRLDIVSMGRRDPVADCREPECAAQNRRAVLHIMKTGLADGGN